MRAAGSAASSPAWSAVATWRVRSREPSAEQLVRAPGELGFTAVVRHDLVPQRRIVELGLGVVRVLRRVVGPARRCPVRIAPRDPYDVRFADGAQMVELEAQA